jgi:uncharacterized OsmC-like protein
MTLVENAPNPLVAVIEATKAAVAADAANAQALFRADHELVGVTEVSVRAGSGHTFTVDEPVSLGGGNTAANPVEYALAALGSCQAITYRFWAAHLGLRVDRVSVHVEGDLDVRGFFGIDDSVRPGFGAVRVSVTVGGPEPAEAYERLQAAVDEHCPVLDLFANPVPVSRSLTVA